MSERDSVKRAVSSEDAVFDDIRPCRDDEVHAELEKIRNDESLIRGIVRLRYPVLSKWCSPVLRMLVRRSVSKAVDSIGSIHDFQMQIAEYMRSMMRTTTDGVTFKDFDKLDPSKGYLFISNHRDISLDPALIDYALHEAGFATVRIAIGDNLIRMPAATALMRLNKSFLVKRNIPSLKQKFRELNHLSEYIGLSVREGHSVWIAQREGRAKDGNDGTDCAVLKMIGMYSRALGVDTKEYMQSLRIVPVSITYEFDPEDVHKAHELQEKAENDGRYNKSEFEDIQSIINGIKGYKGRVSIVAGQPLTEGYESAEELSALIDSFIYSNYAVYPSMLLSAEKLGMINADTERRLGDITEQERSKFFERINAVPEKLQHRVLSMYAAPYANMQKTAAAVTSGNKLQSNCCKEEDESCVSEVLSEKESDTAAGSQTDGE